MTDDEDITMRIAGMQASSTISEELRNVFLESDRIHYRQAFAYIGGISDMTAYVLGTETSGYTSNDVASYLDLLRDRNPSITLAKLKSSVLINFANPFLWFSVYSLLDRYLVYGENETEYPMIHAFGLKYLPSFRQTLTPFGTETRFENLMKSSNRIYEIYFGYDGIGQYTSSRVGIVVEHLFRHSIFDVGGKVEFWNAPIILLSKYGYNYDSDKPTPVKQAMKENGLLTLLNIKVHPINEQTGLYLEGGYKSIGFTEAEQLSDGAIFRGGITIKM
jgi:hypothetical protein